MTTADRSRHFDIEYILEGRMPDGDATLCPLDDSVNSRPFSCMNVMLKEIRVTYPDGETSVTKLDPESGEIVTIP